MDATRVITQSNPFLQDAWDGYRANRLRVLNFIANSSIDNTIILSGDSHANWVSDLASTSRISPCSMTLLNELLRATQYSSE
jgi:phosphodiesterase/alkaline phosphatase D-like protein